MLKFIRKFFLQASGAVLALWLAIQFIPKVEFEGSWQTLMIAGVLLALIHIFIKPLLSLLTFPLKILTLGLFTLILNMGFVWILDIIFPELKIIGLLPLFLTTLLVWGFSSLLFRLEKKRVFR